MKVFNLSYKYDSNPIDCEVCGTNFNESYEAYINDELVWFRYETGCYGSETSEEDILTTVTKYIFNKIGKEIYQYWWDEPTEEKINGYINDITDRIHYLTDSIPHQLIILKAVLDGEFDIELNIEEGIGNV